MSNPINQLDKSINWFGGEDMDASVGSINVTSPSTDHDLSINQVTDQMMMDKIPSQSENDSTLKNGFTKNQVKKLVNEANKVLQPEVTELKYVYFDKLQTYYVQLQDVNTHQVIREIPPKKFMEMYAAIAEKLGLIVNDHA